MITRHALQDMLKGVCQAEIFFLNVCNMKIYNTVIKVNNQVQTTLNTL